MVGFDSACIEDIDGSIIRPDARGSGYHFGGRLPLIVDGLATKR